MADSTPKSYHTDPQLYLYTSLTSGSSHIVTATSRLQTILKANKIPYQMLDVATDDKARMLWGRRAGKRKFPGLIQYGQILADLEQVEEWNEYGEIQENLGTAQSGPKSFTPATSSANTPSKPPPAPGPPPSARISTQDTTSSQPTTSEPFKTPATPEQTQPEQSSNPSDIIRQLGIEAAKKAEDSKTKALEALKAKSSETQKLDNAAPTGMPPPSGSTEATDAKEPETSGADVVSAADTTPSTNQSEAEQEPTNAASAAKEPEDTETRQDNTTTKVPAPSQPSASASPALPGPSSPPSDPPNPDAALKEAAANTPANTSAPPNTTSPPIAAPTATEADKAANTAIASDEASALEATGQAAVDAADGPGAVEEAAEEAGGAASRAVGAAEAKAGRKKHAAPKQAAEIPTASEAEGRANLAIAEDEAGHVIIKPGIGIPSPGAARTGQETRSEGGGEETAAGTTLPVREKRESEEGVEDARRIGQQVTASDDMEALPGSRTQDQPAADGEKVGESVAD